MNRLPCVYLLGLLLPGPLPAQQLTMGFAADWDHSQPGHGMLSSVTMDVDRRLEDSTRVGLRMMAWLPVRADSLRLPRMGAFVTAGRSVLSIFFGRIGVGVLGRGDPNPNSGARFAVMADVMARVVRTRSVAFLVGFHTISGKGGEEIFGIVAAVDVRLWSGRDALTAPPRDP